MDTKIASDFYNAAAESAGAYDPEHDERRYVLDRIRPQLERLIRLGMRVLDLGCGAGRFTFAVEGMGAVPTGIDCAPVPLRQARETAHRRGSRAAFVEGNYCSLPFAGESFDLVMLIDNLVECSYDDIDMILSQLRSILTPGGFFCLRMSCRLAQHQENGRDITRYDPSTGRRESEFQVPGYEPMPYHSYFWTAAFAKFVCSRHLKLHTEERLPDGSYWLVFINERMQL